MINCAKCSTSNSHTFTCKADIPAAQNKAFEASTLQLVQKWTKIKRPWCIEDWLWLTLSLFIQHPSAQPEQHWLLYLDGIRTFRFMKWKSIFDMRVISTISGCCSVKVWSSSFTSGANKLSCRANNPRGQFRWQLCGEQEIFLVCAKRRMY